MVLTVELSKVNDNTEMKITNIDVNNGTMLTKLTKEFNGEDSKFSHLLKVLLEIVKYEKPEQVIFEPYGMSKGLQDLFIEKLQNTYGVENGVNGKLIYGM